MLSRRSRYLVNEKDGQIGASQAAYTYEKHLAKALHHLDRLIVYFKVKYSMNLPPVTVRCQEVKTTNFIHISFK